MTVEELISRLHEMPFDAEVELIVAEDDESPLTGAAPLDHLTLSVTNKVLYLESEDA